MKIRSDTRLGYNIRELTIGRMLARQAEKYGDRTLLTLLPSGRTYSFATLETMTNRVANGMLSILGPRPHVAMLIENSIEGLFALIAVGKLGGVVAPINVAARGELLRYFIELSDAVAIVVAQELVERVLEVLPNVPRLRHIIILPAEEPPLDLDRARLGGATVHAYRHIADSPSTPPGIEVKFTDLCMLAFTSGTTGPSKANMHTQAKCLLNPISHAEAGGYRGYDVLYSCLPIFHTNALHATIYPAIVAGATAVLSRRFSASAFWKEVSENNATVLSLLGSMANILWSQPPGPYDRAHKVRRCGCSPVPSNLEEFEARFGVRVSSGYGLTDFGVPTTLSTDAPLSKARSAGAPRAGWHLRIVDDDGFDLPVGQPGEIALRTDNLWEASLGYYKQPEKTLEAFKNGWFHTGDRGYLDEDGYLWFVDRKKDSMRRRGENVSSFEVEQIILTHPAIADVAVFPVRSEMSEDEIVAAVVLRSQQTVTEAELIEHCRNNMAYFMVPRFLQFLPELPRTLTQKVEKYKLKQWADANRAALWDREAAGIVVRREAR